MQENITQQDLYIATLCHDLKNPLLAQKKTLELISKESFGKLNSSQQEMIQLLLNSTNYMSEMLSSLVEVYKYQNGNIALIPEKTEIDKLIFSAIDEVKSLGVDKNIRIFYQNSNIKIMIDRLQIKRVIINILTNALSYAFENTNVIIRNYKKNGNYVFEFSCLSPEIDEKIKSTIFSKFVSHKSSTGLGLYLSKQIIEAHNGQIYLKNNSIQNTFVFEIPCEKSFKKYVKW